MTTRLLQRSAIILTVALGTQCRPVPAPSVNEVDVRATDYTFAVAESLPAGPTAFGLINEGKVPHEVVVVGMQDGASLDEIVRRDRADSTWRHLRFPPSGLLTADPGITTPGRLLVTLEAGKRYLLLCNFQDTDSSAVHMHMGMVRVVRAY
jgi:hypothetical protein